MSDYSTLSSQLKLVLQSVSPKRLKTLLRLIKNEPLSDVARQVREYFSVQKQLKQYFDSSSSVSPQQYFVDKDNQVVTFPIIAPQFEQVSVSIIVPVYNQWQYTAQCLTSIIKSVQNVSYEIILADDCSNDETSQAADYLENIQIVRPEQNQGFLLNCNHAAQYAKGDYIVLLNNDTVVHEGWLEALVSVAEQDKNVALVGSKLVYPDGTLQEAGGIVWRDGSAWNYGNGDNPAKPEYNYLKQVDYISGASILIRKICWQELGGFDTRYIPAYYEDTDLAFELAHKGYKVIYQPKSVVTHFEGKSHGTSTTTGLKAYQRVNEKKFRQKWQDKLTASHMPNGQGVFLSRDKSLDKRTILIIDHYVPWFDQDAGSRSTFMYVQFFVEQGYNVKFVGDNFYPHQPYTEVLEQMGVEVLYGNNYANNWQGWYLANHSSIDVVYLHRPHIAPKYLDFIKQHSSAKVIYQCHDLHHWRMGRFAELNQCEETKRSASEWKEKELAIFDQVDVGLTFSHDEKSYLQQQQIGCQVEQVPLFLYPRTYQYSEQNSFEQRQDFMFVGGFNHAPNKEGVLWFLKEVWPHVQSQSPNTKFHIVGSKMPDSIKAFESENVVIHGFVSDQELEKLYQQVRVNVLPLLHGAGVKGKLVESFYFGTPVVSTSIGLEGVNAQDHGLEGYNCPHAFAEQLLKLLSSDTDWLAQKQQQQVLFNRAFRTSEVSAHLLNVF